MSQETHSLVTEIVTQFGTSETNINTFKQKFESLNTEFANLATNVGAVGKNLNSFDLNVSKKLKEAVDNISEGTIQLDGMSIKKKIEERLAAAIAGKNVSFTGLTDDDKAKLNVHFSETARKNIEGKVRAYLNRIAMNVSLPTDVGGVNVELHNGLLDNLRNRFRTQLSELIDKDAHFTINGDVKPLSTLPLDQSVINGMMVKVKKEVERLLNSPGFVKLSDNTTKLEFKSDAIDKAVESFKSALGNIDEHLGGIKTSELEKLPNVNEKLKDFKANIQTLVTKVYAVMSSLDTLKTGKEIDLAPLQEAMQNLQKTVYDRSLSQIRALQKEFHAMSTADTKGTANDFKVLDGMNQEINAYIAKSIKHAEKALEEALSIQTQTIDGKKVKAPSIKKLQQQIINAAQQAVGNLDLGDLHIDVKLTKQLFHDWQTDTANKMHMASAQALQPLQTSLLSSNKKVIEEFVKSIVDVTNIKLNPEGNAVNPIDVNLDTAKLRKQVETELKTIADKLVGNVNFSEAGEKALAEGIKLPKRIADSMNTTVRNLLEQQATKLAEQVQERKGSKFSEAHLEKFDKAMLEQSTKLINNIVQQAHEISKVMSEGIGSSGFKNFNADEQRKIKEHFNETATKMVQDYSHMMENALGTFAIAGSVAKDVQNNIEAQLNRILSEKAIHFNDDGTPLQLKGLVGEAQKRLQNAIKENVENWEPESHNFKPSIDYDNIIDPIQKSINRMLNNLGDEIARRINGIVVPKTAVTKAQQNVTDVAEPNFKLNPKDMHKDVRKYLAEEEDLKVKDWEKQISYTGDKGIGQVMAANVAVVMQKFHDTIGRHAKAAITLYQGELDGLNPTPNTQAVNFLAIKMGQMQDDIHKKIQEIVNAQFKAITDAIKGFKSKPYSMGFDEDEKLREAFRQFMRSNMKNAKDHVDKDNARTGDQSQKAEEPRKGKTQSTAHDDNKNSIVPIQGTPTVIVNDPNALPKPRGRKDIGGNDVLKNEEERDLYIRAGRIAVQNGKNRFANKMDPQLTADFHDFLDNHYMKGVKDIAEKSRYAYSAEGTPEDRAKIREEKTYLAQELRMAMELIRKQLAGESLNTKTKDFSERQNAYMDNTALKIESLRNRYMGDFNDEQKGRFSSALHDIVTRANELGTKDVRNLSDITGLKHSMDALDRELKNLIAAMKQTAKENKTEKKRGDLLTQHDALKGNLSLQNETLQTVLRLVPALEQYSVRQLRVNNATDTWSARLRDAEGNVRSLSGTIDRATGELYQHSEALSKVTKQAGALNYGGGGGRYTSGSDNIFDRYYNRPNYNTESTYNPNGDFGSSVTNTMRYITAGALMGAPTMAFYQGWESTKEFDYQMERARQNFVIKGSSVNEDDILQDVAEDRVRATGVDPETSPGRVKAEQDDLKKFAYGEEANRKIQDIALAYSVPMEEVAKAFHIGSRSVADPKEAFSVAQAVARGNAIEEVDSETAAKGLESVMNQYQISGFSTNRVMDMMIMGAQYSPAHLEDFLATQQRAGAIFKDNLPGMTKEDAIATSIGLTGIFSQATARSGAEGGTLYKSLLPRFYSGQGLAALEEVSHQKGFESLNPYTEDGKKKDFVDVFSSFLEKSMQLTDADRMDLWKKIVPGWHTGSVSAMESFLEGLTGDVQRTRDNVAKETGNENIGFKDALEEYFAKIKTDDPQMINMLQQGSQDTWKMRIQNIKTMWTATFESVITSFKGDFGLLATHLNVLMRAIRDNADQVAAMVAVASKVAVGLGVKYAANKMLERADAVDKEKKAERFGRIDRYLGAEQQALNLRRTAVMAESSAGRRALDAISERRAPMLENRNRANAELTAKQEQRKELQRRMTELENTAPNVDNSAEYYAMRKQVQDLDKDISKLTSTTEEYESELSKLDQEEDKVKASTKGLDREMREINEQMDSVNNRVRLLGEAYKDVGLDATKLKTQVEKLDSEFTAGMTDAEKYDKAITDIGRQADMSDEQLARFKTELNHINDAFRSGETDARQYLKQIDRLERAHLTGVAGVQGGGVGASAANQSGLGLSNAIIAGSMFAPLMMGRRGVVQRVKDFATTRSLSDLVGRGKAMTDASGNALRDRSGNIIYARDVARNNRMNNVADVTTRAGARQLQAETRVAGTVGGAVGKLGKFGKVGKLLMGGGKLIPGLGTALMLGTLATEGFDIASSSRQTQGEKATAQYTKLQEMSNTVQSIDSYSKWNPMKYLMGAVTLGDMGIGGLNHLAGGSGVSFENSAKLLKTGWANFFSTDKDKDKLKEDFANQNFTIGDPKGEEISGKLTDLRQAADNLYMKEMEPEQQDDPEGESLDELTDAQNKELEELEELNEQISKIDNTLSRSLSKNQSEYTIEQSKLLLQGVDEDSQQMRDLMDDFLRKNMASWDAALADIANTKNEITDKDSDEYKDLETKEQELKAQKASAQVQQRQNQMSQYDEIMNNLSEALQKNETEYGIQQDEAQLNGATTDSTIMKKLETEKVNKSNATMEKAQADLQNLIKTTNAQGSELTKIQQAILDIEKDQKDNLVAIKESLDTQKATFNLSGDVQPVSYMDYMMDKNTFKNVTTKSGDVTINLNIDNMTGSQSDIDKVQSSLATAVKQANQQLARDFNAQVLSGFGKSFV